MTSVRLSNQTQVIGVQSFYGCSSLKKIKLPASITKIGLEAFRGCSSLLEMRLDAITPPEITRTIGYKGVLVVPQKSKEIYQENPLWKDNVFK
ncbi:hypothetical protein CAPN010_15940 [Capnocytophaga cynodegmi]|uniref:leucine-rich repeat domain-containing protein n=1 Tax=Capnocytophaga cynodegmi TaxID=28189 RepID=UPI002081B68A|nr:leucine-rich repeat domain-containing protein [Capnocytophaga cynodegmi]GJQ07436.1 hypothetical protein CAPN010_15940 [Capnocytophaga cynodegmi]